MVDRRKDSDYQIGWCAGAFEEHNAMAKVVRRLRAALGLIASGMSPNPKETANKALDDDSRD